MEARARGHPSRLAVKNGEHLRMTAVDMVNGLERIFR
jgi:hypothetical protein